ncbi:MAG: NUDIX hydrolase [Chloroflexi bacterium]|nr:NUDIX hydrolase [Chloroflexota bacterium]MCI0578475.1 NUDIX hydrolase [Chloroflexota bacterium]MCI0643921.1 NUDIX hydrolase [Chloroflexota bacterium]MCI0729169.1 NUDIX hydrolase [Chloroflexota bacterium]
MSDLARPETPNVQPWPKIESRPLGSYRVFTLRQDTSRSPRTGREHHFYVLDSTDWINVIPLTPEGQIVLIRQYRHGTEEVTLEIPGGMVDLEDGSPAVSAARELLEETGYAAEEMVPLGSVSPNPAILSNRCHTFLARQARPVATPLMDGAEDIQFELVEQSAIPHLITSGQITHALVIAAFYFYEQHQKRLEIGD